MRSIIMVTGATGFVGSALVRRLVQQRGPGVLAAVRRSGREISAIARCHSVGDLLPDTDWTTALVGVNTVVHVAARVHMMKDSARDPLAEFRLVNVEGTLNLARQAAAAGVARLIFLSSIKVNGEATALDQAFRSDDAPSPQDPYAVSKLEAERLLGELAAHSGMEVVTIRPPLVYGPGVKANFLTMMRWLRRGVPLPLGAIDNRRSFVALDNLVDLIITCIDHPAAANQIFVVSDGEDLSTPQLLRRLGRALGSPARLIPVPVGLLKMGAALVGKPDFVERLCGSLQIDMSQTRRLLKWQPVSTVDESLENTAREFLRKTRN